MDEQNERQMEPEYIESPLESLDLDAAGLDGKPLATARDKSLKREVEDYDENSGPGGASGLADDPTLQGSTGLADDVGMHVEPGFSIGYDTGMDYGFDGDTGNELTGGSYTSLADAANGLPVSASPDGGTGVETALGVPDVGELPHSERVDLTYETVADDDGGYGVEGTDSDLEGDMAS